LVRALDPSCWNLRNPPSFFDPPFNAMTMLRLTLLTLAAAALTACSTTKLDEPPKAPVETRPDAPVATGTNTPTTVPTPESKVATVDLSAELTKAVANQRTVYFDFDSFTVKDEYTGLMDAHAKRLAQIKALRLVLEGHTDSRGSREYNLALGQKRAEAVAQRLAVSGVSASQVEPVSFGKERPAAEGTGEAAWAKNRRVELKDK
jgi:peptidoglycan-associated lipoprotein